MTKQTLNIDGILIDAKDIGTINLEINLEDGYNQIKEYTLHIEERSLNIIQYVPKNWKLCAERDLTYTSPRFQKINLGAYDWAVLSNWFIQSLHEIGHAREFAKDLNAAKELEPIYERFCVVNCEKSPDDVKIVLNEELKAWSFAIEILTQLKLPEEFMHAAYRFTILYDLKSYFCSALSKSHEQYINSRNIGQYKEDISKMFIVWAKTTIPEKYLDQIIHTVKIK